jgi:DnaJ-class molecular chaperone
MRKICQNCRGKGIVGEWKGNVFTWHTCVECGGEGIVED